MHMKKTSVKHKIMVSAVMFKFYLVCLVLCCTLMILFRCVYRYFKKLRARLDMLSILLLLKSYF
jgi:hypothetical protein